MHCYYIQTSDVPYHFKCGSKYYKQKNVGCCTILVNIIEHKDALKSDTTALNHNIFTYA